MTKRPTADTLYEVIDCETHVTVAYFATSHEAEYFAASLPNAKVMIYLG